MAYKTEELYKKALEAIEANNLFFLADVYGYLGISHDTYYNHFPIDSEESEYIKEKIEANKIKTKVSIRSKLHKSTAPAALISLYKLISTDEERKALSMVYNDHVSSDKSMSPKGWESWYDRDRGKEDKE